MEIIGRLSMLLPERRGEGARGPWVRGGFVIDTEEQFSRKIAFDVWGDDRINAIKGIPAGTQIKVVFTIESRENNERWYTSCRCTNVETFTSAMPQNPYGQPQQGYQMPPQGYGQPTGQPQMPPQGYNQPSAQPQMPQQPAYQQPAQSQMPIEDTQVPYQQPPVTPQSMGGTIEQASMPEETDDLPF
ncbi:MAG: DUF3127 domain-containing protein [Bacteroidales bacterium]|nr:DUF3127 domain-containing protein [Bacteroidales bacterium]